LQYIDDRCGSNHEVIVMQGLVVGFLAILVLVVLW
jgi:hypothetical protein